MVWRTVTGLQIENYWNNNILELLKEEMDFNTTGIEVKQRAAE